jgi:hypothetical protein
LLYIEIPVLQLRVLVLTELVQEEACPHRFSELMEANPEKLTLMMSELMKANLEKLTLMMQHMKLDSNAREAQREEREAQREAREAQRAEDLRLALASILNAVRPPPTLPSASQFVSSTSQSEEREAQREAREAQREAQREEREAQREAREAQRAEDLRLALASILNAVRPPPTLPSASQFVSSTSQSSGSTSPSRSSPRSQQSSNAAGLRLAFLNATNSGLSFDIGDMPLPFLSPHLETRGVLFAHRIACKGTIGESKDFDVCLNEENKTILRPPTNPKKAGLSFFIPLSSSHDVLQAAHTYHCANGSVTTNGCLAYPLRHVPDGMALTIDKIQVTTGDLVDKPIMLHASLSTLSDMSLSTFTERVESWLEKCVCNIAAAGENSDNENVFEKEIGTVWSDQGGMKESRGSGDVTETLLKEVAHRLSSELPTGGSPGAFL